MNDAPSIGERYSAAIESSDLRVRAEKRGDVDILIAAGWVGEGLGPMLYRLQVEFDLVRADVRGPGTLSPIERYLILEKMKTLRPARQALGSFVVEEAEKWGAPWEPAVLRLLMGQVLDVFLDPTCHHCEGRGFHGGTHRGEQQVLCRPCRGSSHRRDQIGKDAAQAHFGAHLLAQLERQLVDVERAMKRFLRDRPHVEA